MAQGKDKRRGVGALDLTDLAEETVVVKSDQPAWLERAAGWVDIISKIALMGAAVVAYLEYQSAVEEKKSELSFEIVKDWESDRFREANFAIRTAVRDTKESFEESYGENPDKAHFEENFFVRDLKRKVLDDPVFEQSVQDLFYFYSKVGLCVKQELCSADILTEYFQDSAMDFYGKFEFMAGLSGKGDPEFAGYIRSFIGRSD